MDGTQEKGKRKDIQGIITALATPFVQGELDFVSFKKLLHFQVSQGIDGFVVNGTTAESPCLLPEEVEQLFEWTRKVAQKAFLILGVGGNSTKKTLENIKKAKEWKADAVLAVVPYYNKPPQRGLVWHFQTLADKSELPLFLYNVPARTGVELSLESIVELSLHPNIKGIKEASGNRELGKNIIEKTRKDFILLSGDDDTCFDLCALGAQGVVSVVSHILGKEMKRLFQMIKQGEKKEQALKEYKDKYKLLLRRIYCESNPIGIKMALHLMGLFHSAELRSPLVVLSEQETKKLKKELRSVGLLSE
ncbi:MAG: 4-hydroxy-tetrahydrodipicolinate synthase [Bdellovibrionales bacterium]|nr:4-hydroxy-tetrahydrodipicolinate synthase [Bdellovibrionales bacterium]